MISDHKFNVKVAFVTDAFSCYKFEKIDLLQKGFTREMLSTMRIKLRFLPKPI